MAYAILLQGNTVELKEPRRRRGTVIRPICQLFSVDNRNTCSTLSDLIQGISHAEIICNKPWERKRNIVIIHRFNALKSLPFQIITPQPWFRKRRNIDQRYRTQEQTCISPDSASEVQLTVTILSYCIFRFWRHAHNAPSTHKDTFVFIRRFTVI